MLKHFLAFLFFAVISLTLTNFVFAQVPDIGETVCVPVNPMTGEPDPTICDGDTYDNTDIEDTYDDETYDELEDESEQLDDKPKECVAPAQRDCNAECQSSTSKKCTYNGPRNCNAECSHLQSYPTYEKEACITKCVDEDTADRNAYYECLNQPAGTILDNDCVNACLGEVKKGEEEYEQCLAENKKTQEKNNEIDKKSDLPINVLYALDEYARWDNGAKVETDSEMADIVKEYNTAGRCPQNSVDKPWSAAFISYVMKQSGVDFPADCAHINYFRSIKNNPGECQTSPMSEKANVKPGDILCKCRGTNCAIDYNNIPSDFASSHCDIIISKDGNSVKAVGGNVGDSVKISNINLNDPKLFGFISCEEQKIDTTDVIKPPIDKETNKPKVEEKSEKNEGSAKNCPLPFFLLLSVVFFSFTRVRK